MSLDDHQLRLFLAGRADRANPSGLRARVVEQARATPQLSPVPANPRLRRSFAARTVWVSLAAVTAVVLVLIGARLPSFPGGTGAQPGASGAASATPGTVAVTVALPTSPTASFCPQALTGGELAGSATDPWVAWLIASDGKRINVRWPPGYSAYFDPVLQLLDPQRVTVATAGDAVTIGGAGGADGVWNSCEVEGSAGPTEVPLTPPPYAAGSCPVTPFTFLRGGVVPIVQASGIDWDFGGIPWIAEVGQKLVFPTTLQANVIAAERLPIGPTHESLSARYPEGGGPGFVFGVGLPTPGCWLLTEAGSKSASSIIVSAGSPPAAPDSAASQNVPIKVVQQTDLSVCPTSPLDPASSFRTWVDGANRWTDPATTVPWMPGHERKLVQSGPIAAAAPFRIVVAARLGSVWAGQDQRSALVADQPVFATPNGADSSAVSLTLPSAGCWVITDVNPTTTSTIVVEVGG